MLFERDREKVIAAFVRDGHLTRIPSKRWKRVVVLDVIVQDFEPGIRYSEAQVNATLNRWHRDTAALRRYLVDEDYLDRDDDGGRVLALRRDARPVAATILGAGHLRPICEPCAHAVDRNRHP